MPRFLRLDKTSWEWFDPESKSCLEVRTNSGLFYRSGGKWIKREAQDRMAYDSGRLPGGGRFSKTTVYTYAEVTPPEVAEALKRDGRPLPPELVVDLAPRPPQKRDTDERDKWLYDALCDLKKTGKQILAEFKERAKRKQWRVISHYNSMKSAANKFAARHSLSPVPSRHDK
jgi:hypothetical protein